MGLYISVTTASSELADSPINAAITTLAVSVAGMNRQGRIPAGPSLDVTFLLPGKLEKPDFSGMRMGGYTPEGGTLYFQTAVPEHILKSPEAGHYVAMVMQDVVSNAGEYFQDYLFEHSRETIPAEKIAFDKASWKTLMKQVTTSPVTH